MVTLNLKSASGNISTPEGPPPTVHSGHPPVYAHQNFAPTPAPYFHPYPAFPNYNVFPPPNQYVPAPGNSSLNSGVTIVTGATGQPQLLKTLPQQKKKLTISGNTIPTPQPIIIDLPHLSNINAGGPPTIPPKTKKKKPKKIKLAVATETAATPTNPPVQTKRPTPSAPKQKVKELQVFIKKNPRLSISDFIHPIHNKLLKKHGKIEAIEKECSVAITLKKGKFDVTQNTNSKQVNNKIEKELSLILERECVIPAKITTNKKIEDRLLFQLDSKFPKNQFIIYPTGSTKSVKYVGYDKKTLDEIDWALNDMLKIRIVAIPLTAGQIKRFKQSKLEIPYEELLNTRPRVNDKKKLVLETLFPEMYVGLFDNIMPDPPSTMEEKINFSTIKVVNLQTLLPKYGNDAIREYVRGCETQISIKSSAPTTNINCQDVKSWLEKSTSKVIAEEMDIEFTWINSFMLLLKGFPEKINEFKTKDAFKGALTAVSIDLDAILPSSLQRIWEEGDIRELVLEHGLVLEINQNNKRVCGSANNIIKFRNRVATLVKEGEYTQVGNKFL